MIIGDMIRTHRSVWPMLKRWERIALVVFYSAAAICGCIGIGALLALVLR